MPSPHQSLFDSISTFDIVMLAEVLYDDPEFKLVEKDKLMKALHEKLDRFKALGDTYLEQFVSQCDIETCCADTWIFITFIGNRSFKHFDLVLQFAKEGITEIRIGMPYCLNKAIGLEIHKAGKMPVELNGHTGKVTAIRYQHRGNKMASGDQYGLVSVWNPKKNTEMTAAALLSKEISTLQWSPSDELLAAASIEGEIVLIKI